MDQTNQQGQATYKGAGVDIDKALTALDLMKPHIARTHNKYVLASVGPYGSVFDLSIIDPRLTTLLIESIDGPGTLPILARMLWQLTGDLRYFEITGKNVATHCECDIATCGARPITLVDNIGSTTMEPVVYEAIIKGMVEACIDGDYSLVGGESAQLPGLIVDGEYDFCAHIAGLVDQKDFINPLERIRPGDTLVGVASNGLHLNGWSLLRKIIFEILKMTIDQQVDFSGKSIAETFITEQPNYAAIVQQLMHDGLGFMHDVHTIQGNCHITGGGLYDNVERVLPEGCRAVIDSRLWAVPEAFRWLVSKGNVDLPVAYRTWNMGIGWVFIVRGSEDASWIINRVEDKFGLDAWTIGQIVEGERGVDIQHLAA